MIEITVFTPTYNRSYILPQLYESLIRQSNKNFEWLIIDDGSTDDTRQLVEQWIAENIIFIRYYKTTNGGKSRAINKGVNLAKGELFFIVDSDDYLVNDSIETVLYHWNTINDKTKYSGVCGRKIFPNGEKAGGDNKAFEVLDSDNLSFHYILGILGDMAEVFRTDLLRDNPFPEIDDEIFVPEALIWNKITHLYPMRYFNKETYVCEYLSDGYTKNFKRNLQRNPKGFSLYYQSVLFNRQRIPLFLRLKSFVRLLQCCYYSLFN